MYMLISNITGECVEGTLRECLTYAARNTWEGLWKYHFLHRWTIIKDAFRDDPNVPW